MEPQDWHPFISTTWTLNLSLGVDLIRNWQWIKMRWQGGNIYVCAESAKLTVKLTTWHLALELYLTKQRLENWTSYSKLPRQSPSSYSVPIIVYNGVNWRLCLHCSLLSPHRLDCNMIFLSLPTALLPVWQCSEGANVNIIQDVIGKICPIIQLCYWYWEIEIIRVSHCLASVLSNQQSNEFPPW